MKLVRHNRQTLAVAAALCVLTFGTWWPMLHNEFVNYDDPEYVTENTQVQRGLTFEGMRWAFRTDCAGNWHPITWLSHLLDVQLYGLNPRGHHFTSLALHVANSLLLLVVLNRLTGALWPSAWVAALFALHPAHVESVAWVAERKDVLSALFWMLTLWAYAGYARRCEGQSPKSELHSSGPQGKQHATHVKSSKSSVSRSSALYYALALAFFALGLMSKPMLVTLPFVLLLLDYWPLKRVASFDLGVLMASARNGSSLIAEKVPFLVLAVVSSIVTFQVQQQAGAVGENPLVARISNAVISYVRYLGKLFWPDDLAVFYPRPADWPAGTVFIAAAALFGATALALRLGRQRPFLPVGWLWYLGTLAPVIGVVQVGEQAIADRYTYLPSVGLFMVIAWGATEVTTGWRKRKGALACMATILLASCVICTRAQLWHWQSSESLFTHALEVTEDNAVAHNNLGIALEEKGNLAEATAHYAEAVRIKPNFSDAQANLGIQLARQGRIPEALEHFHAALALKPNAKVHYNLGNLFVEQGDWSEAIKHLSAALNQQPEFAEAHYNLGLALLMQGKGDEAVRHYREALRLKPDWPLALNELALLLATHPKAEIRNGTEAVTLAERACELTGQSEIRYLSTLDMALAEAGQFDEAIRVAEHVREVAWAAGQTAAAEAAGGRLVLYHARTPYRQP